MGAFWWGCPVSQRSILFWMPQTASLKLCERHASKTSMSDPGPAAVRTHGAAIPAGTDGLVRHFSKPSPSFSLAPGSGLCAAASLLRHRRAGFALSRSTLRDCWRRARWGGARWGRARGAVVAVWNHAPARPDAPCALPLPLHFLCQSAHDPAACLQGYFSAGTTAPRCARPLGWPAQQVRRPPLPQRTLSGRRSRRQSRSPKRIRAQGRRAAEPPSAERVCAATAITAAASETAASEHARRLRARAPPPTPLPPSPPPPILQSRSRPFPPAPRRSPFCVVALVRAAGGAFCSAERAASEPSAPPPSQPVPPAPVASLCAVAQSAVMRLGDVQRLYFHF